MKAHGLDDMAYAKAFMRKVLTEGIDDQGGLRQPAQRHALQGTGGIAELRPPRRAGHRTFERAQKGVVDKYTRQTLEVSVGEDNTGVRLALYFERMASSITSGYSIIADDALAQVVRTALSFPRSSPPPISTVRPPITRTR